VSVHSRFPVALMPAPPPARALATGLARARVVDADDVRAVRLFARAGGVIGRALFAVSLVVLLVGTTSCVGLGRALTSGPRLFVSEEKVVDGPGPACGGVVEVAAGPLPDGAIELSRYQITASAPVPLSHIVNLMGVHGQRRCAHGVRVLRADVAEGADGIVSAFAVAYALPAR
jgi:hypothetical protein